MSFQTAPGSLSKASSLLITREMKNIRANLVLILVRIQEGHQVCALVVQNYLWIPTLVKCWLRPIEVNHTVFEHYTISQLRALAAWGCALCSILSHESRKIDDGNMRSFFEIPPTAPLGLRNEIVWATAPGSENVHSVDRLNFYYFTVPSKL